MSCDYVFCERITRKEAFIYTVKATMRGGWCCLFATADTTAWFFGGDLKLMMTSHVDSETPTVSGHKEWHGDTTSLEKETQREPHSC